jgi:hypothetical protein
MRTLSAQALIAKAKQSPTFELTISAQQLVYATEAIENEARRQERDKMLAMRRDFNHLPHKEFPAKWPDWRQYEEVLPTYCGCGDCTLWRSGS